MMLTRDTALEKSRNVPDETNGFEVWRVYHAEWEPQVANRFAGLLVRVLN